MIFLQKQHLISMGGSCLKSAVARVGKGLLHHELQLQFNWSGSKGRNSEQAPVRRTFKGTRAMDVVSGTEAIFGISKPICTIG